MKFTPKLIGAILAAAASPAQAGEIFGGVYVHDVDTPLTKSGFESGADIQLGYRGGRIGSTPLQPYLFGAVNSAGNTNYAAVGLSAKFGQKIFFRPGFGIAIHDGSADKFQRTDRVAFGSRVLAEIEANLGYQLDTKFSVEASWVHMSHGQLFGRQNPGMDNIGVRLNYALGRKRGPDR